MRRDTYRPAGRSSLTRRSILLGGIGCSAAYTLRHLGGAAEPSGRSASAGFEIQKSKISVLDYIPRSEWAAIRDGTSNYDCTKDIHRAVAAIKGTGRQLSFPEGSYLVSTVTLDGSDYSLDTSSARFQQKKHVAGDMMPIIRIISASRVTIGHLNVAGNIAEDSGENCHGVVLSQCKDVRIDGVFATDVRGDALYCYARNTSEAERQFGCYVRLISGSNVFRNLLTVVGGQLHVGAIVNKGPVGYRDFDVEPNDAYGTYEAVDLQIDSARVGSCEITSDDPKVINRVVRIGTLDADFNRVKATTPAYPKAPGAGAYALGISRTEKVEIGHFRARNYNVYTISLAQAWSTVDIGTLDIARCSLTDSKYDTMILQQGNAHGGKIRIGTLLCEAANTKYLARVHNTGILKIDVENIRKMKCLIGVQISGRFANGVIDLNGSSRVALVNSKNVTFERISTKNAAAATGFAGCTGVRVVDSELGFGKLDLSGRSDIVSVNSRIGDLATPR
jgi:hypothetical protein